MLALIRLAEILYKAANTFVLLNDLLSFVTPSPCITHSAYQGEIHIGSSSSEELLTEHRPPGQLHDLVDSSLQNCFAAFCFVVGTRQAMRFQGGGKIPANVPVLGQGFFDGVVDENKSVDAPVMS